MAGERKDIIDMKCLKSENGEVLTGPHAVNGRWRHYMEKLLNAENDNKKKQPFILTRLFFPVYWG